MAYFPRQKRQARFYWAELGFLVMGLFALQPSLLTSLFSNAVPIASSYSDRLNYPISQNYQGLMGRDWAGNQLVQSYMAPLQGWQNQNLPSGNSQIYSNPNPSLSYGAYPYANPASLAVAPYSLTGQYSPSAQHSPSNPYSQSYPGTYATGYPGLAGPSLQGTTPWTNYASNGSHSEYLGNPQPNYYTSSSQTTPQLSQNGWPNQTAYVAQGNGQWPNTSNYNRGVTPNSNWPQNNANNPFNSLLTKSQQTSLYRNGDGSGTYSPSAQRYAYPAASPNFDTWTPYQPSGSSLYR